MAPRKTLPKAAPLNAPKSGASNVRMKPEQSEEFIDEQTLSANRQEQSLQLQDMDEQPQQNKRSHRASRGSKRDWSQYSANPPNKGDLAKNGRQTGRVLIPWTRPRMAEKLLLHIEYEALVHNIKLPWDHIAHRLSPGSSGAAVQQHLARMRTNLIAEGHMVPPIGQKPGGPPQPDANVRGLVRMFPDSITNVETREVSWNEPVDDLTKPLGSAVYALQHNNEDRGENEAGKSSYNDDADGLRREDNSSGINYDGAVRSEHSGRPVRAVKRVSYAESPDHEVLAQNPDIDSDNVGEMYGDRDELQSRNFLLVGDSKRRALPSGAGDRPERQSREAPMTPPRHKPQGYPSAVDDFRALDAPHSSDGGLAYGYGAPAFMTDDQFDGDFNFVNATPVTAQNMFDHLCCYNTPGRLQDHMRAAGFWADDNGVLHVTTGTATAVALTPHKPTSGMRHQQQQQMPDSPTARKVGSMHNDFSEFNAFVTGSTAANDVLPTMASRLSSSTSINARGKTATTARNYSITGSQDNTQMLDTGTARKVQADEGVLDYAPESGSSGSA